MQKLSSQKYLPHLRTYLESRPGELGTTVNARGVLLALLGSLLVGGGLVFFFSVRSIPPGIMAIILGVSLTVFGVLSTSRQEAPEKAVLRSALRNFTEADQQRKLHRRLDGTAAQLLEASAYRWIHIRDVLALEPWTSAQKILHYQTLRTEILAAADAAMDQLVVILASCIGTPQESKQRDFQRVLEDFAEFDLGDAFKGLREIFQGDTAKYTFRSANISAVFEPARSLAEKLSQLSAEVDSLTGALVTSQSTIGIGGSTTLSGIDSVIQTMRATKQAEVDVVQNELRH
ncbi:MAG: hypothetical protein K8R88_05910 [Armatimonadetes bacterium]|nr:hypothetical protein [Armatimonadota bacterium]